MRNARVSAARYSLELQKKTVGFVARSWRRFKLDADARSDISAAAPRASRASVRAGFIRNTYI
jgi:hypothetical protein